MSASLAVDGWRGGEVSDLPRRRPAGVHSGATVPEFHRLPCTVTRLINLACGFSSGGQRGPVNELCIGSANGADGVGRWWPWPRQPRRSSLVGALRQRLSRQLADRGHTPSATCRGLRPRSPAEKLTIG